ncbi:MAG: type VI secretion system baseplate subunit TssE [Gammaproteobacteria bacterium]|nr:type VI secretion system baseplate subunit TssE [Gammaproteobacteria bacterium]
MKKTIYSPSLIDKLLTDSNVYTRFNKEMALNSIMRDLQDLLNTHKPYQQPSDDATLLNYGLDDYTHLHPHSDADKEQLQQDLQRLISDYEPRLKNITVIIQDTNQDDNFALKFSINGTLCLYEDNNEQLPVQFNSVYDTSMSHFNVKEGRVSEA